MMRRGTAALAAAASAVVVTQALYVSRLTNRGGPAAQRQKSSSASSTDSSKVALQEEQKQFPTAQPDSVKPESDGDLVTDGKTHDEEHRHEAEHFSEEQQGRRSSPHTSEQAKLDTPGYRPQPPAPIPFIAATCAEICASDCATQGIGAEMDYTYREILHGAASITPSIVSDAVGNVGDYFRDIAESFVPGMNLGRHEHAGGDAAAGHLPEQRKVVGHQTVAAAAVDVTTGAAVQQENKKASAASSLLQWRKSGVCLAECQAAVDKCSDEIDSSDSVPEDVEEYTVIPQKSHCEDVTKLHFIAESGNLKWSLRFGQSPTFGQLAGLAEPFDLLTQADLTILSHCAEGGDFASLSLGNAIGLAKCMVEEVHSYAHSIAQGIERAHAGDPEDTLNKEEMNPIAVDPVVEDENGEFHMPEEVFYVNDARCFSGCAGLKVQGVLENCEKHGHCATDFADLLWRTGALYAPTTMANAVNDMGYAHATDPAAVPAALAQLWKEDPALKQGEELQGTVDAKAAAKKLAESAPASAPETIPAHKDETSPLYDGAPTSTAGDHTPPFCRMQMCAPYPATWIQGRLLKKMYELGALEQCPKVEAVFDVHPREMYDGAMPDPKLPDGSASLLAIRSVRRTPVHPIVVARKKAIERRQRTWTWGALKASGYKGSDWPVAEEKSAKDKTTWSAGQAIRF